MIIAAGLSPAWQQILVFDEIAVGEVNRAAEAVWCASGKVLNVSRAIMSLGVDGQTVCPVGGLSGDAIRDEFTTDAIPATWITTDVPTRVCTTIVEQASGRVTEFVENAPAISADELSAFEAAYAEALRMASGAAAASVAVLTGSLPSIEGQGKPVGLYRRLLADGPRAILDVRGPELHEALRERPLLVKPNRDELASTVARPLPDDAAVWEAMRELNAAGAEWVLVTAGAGEVLLSSQTSHWTFVPPRVPVVNPIGCGDCLAAGIAVAIAEGADMADAVRFGLGAAADNAGQLFPARLDRDRVSRHTRAIEVKSR